MKKDDATLAEHPDAEKAMVALVEIIDTKNDEGKPIYSGRDRISASSVILTYRMQKPAAKSEVTLSSAEEWLASLAG